MKPGDSLVIEAGARRPSSTPCARRATRCSAPPSATAPSSSTRSRRRRSAGRLDRRAGRRPLPPERRDDGALFGYAVGPHSWKRFLHPPTVVRWRARRDDGGFTAEPERTPPPRYAFVGVRPCELAAIARPGPRVPRRPVRRPGLPRAPRGASSSSRSTAATPAAPASARRWAPGPRPGRASTSRSPRSSAAAARARGRGRAPSAARRSRRRSPPRPAEAADLEAAARSSRARRGGRWAARSTPTAQGAALPPLRETRGGTRSASAAWPARTARWSARPASARPSRTRPTSPARQTERRRSGTRASRRSSPTSTAAACARSAGARYRQWITHKLATWHDQFGVSGCVGCGRCITWCPVGIDITAEARAVRQRATRKGADRDDPFLRADPRGAPVLPATFPGRTSTPSRGASSNVVFEPGEFVFREGQAADRFYVVREGRVAVEVFVPNKGAVTIETIEGGEMLGWSWLFPPYTRALRRAGAQRRPGARRSTAPACARSARRTPPSATSSRSASPQVVVRAARGDAHAAPGPLWPQRLSRVAAAVPAADPMRPRALRGPARARGRRATRSR